MGHSPKTMKPARAYAVGCQPDRPKMCPARPGSATTATRTSSEIAAHSWVDALNGLEFGGGFARTTKHHTRITKMTPTW
ncbi:hypothetical protein L3i22_013930 [Actinoplanes sp. L3-i22]|nr:hypothetical protein L3i22_013930 [Actinoplanes sp. L3-i22]